MPSNDRIEASPGRRIGNPRPLGRTLPVVPTSGSGVVSDVRTRIVVGRVNTGEDTLDPPSFYPLSIVGQGGGVYKVTLQPGTVGAWNPVSGEDTFALEVPTVNGSPVTDLPRPELTVAVDEWVSVTIRTDGNNQIKEPPTIQVSDSFGAHYNPEVGETEPVDGEYCIKLFKLVTTPEGGVTVEPGHPSDIDVVPYLWPGVNKGGGIGRVLWKYDSSTGEYHFRTLNPGYGVEVRESGSLIEPWFLAANVGAGQPVYKVPDAPGPFSPAQFKTLVQPSEGQINLTSSADEVRIRGNSVDGSIAFLSCDGTTAASVVWKDGLILTAGGLSVQLGDCSDSSTAAPGP